MENLSDSRKKDLLPEFQAFLLDKKPAQERNVFFYALWAGKFLIHSNKKSKYRPINIRKTPSLNLSKL